MGIHTVRLRRREVHTFSVLRYHPPTLPQRGLSPSKTCHPRVSPPHAHQTQNLETQSSPARSLEAAFQLLTRSRSLPTSLSSWRSRASAAAPASRARLKNVDEARLHIATFARVRVGEQWGWFEE